MAQVTVKINGYPYTVGCEDGQEAHLQAMAGQVDSRVESIKALGQTGEAKLLVLATLLMADELHDLTEELAEARRAARAPVKPETGKAEASKAEIALQRRLARLATRAEDIASSLEGA